jgi:hypothetical protein
MATEVTRRDFIGTTLKAGAAVGLADLAFLHGLPPVSAQEAKLPRAMVRLSPDIEPLVRLIEETPRERLMDVIAGKVRSGTSYQHLLAALMLAGVRGVQPRPVGFKFHAVLVVNSAHLASLASPDRERWLPLFWALDYFKSSQARNKVEGDWVMPPLDESQLPPSHQAKRRLIEALDNWDEEGADRAAAMFARVAGAEEIAELFWRYGARDFRDIGHKAIYAANAYRTLHTIGWRHAEPVIRSLALAMLDKREAGNPARNDYEADRPGRENIKRIAQIRTHWQRGRVAPSATTELLAALRTASYSEASEKVVALLNQEVDPVSIWDGLLCMAGELLMRQPGIVALHAVTTTNALHFGFQTSGNDETRRLLLLQAAAFLTMFREAMRGRGKVRDDVTIDTLPKADLKRTGAEAVEEILADVSRDRMAAARKTLALLEADRAAAEPLMTAARRLIFFKGNDSHDYKFSSAALEDFYHATPAWRNRFLATSMFNLHGSQDRDNDLIKRVQAALAG